MKLHNSKMFDQVPLSNLNRPKPRMPSVNAVCTFASNVKMASLRIEATPGKLKHRLDYAHYLHNLHNDQVGAKGISS